MLSCNFFNFQRFSLENSKKFQHLSFQIISIESDHSERYVKTDKSIGYNIVTPEKNSSKMWD
jgi:hypothetical protein